MTSSPVQPTRLGLWLHIPGTFATEISVSAGADWYCIDLQHGMVTESDVLGMLQVTAAAPGEVLVRTPSVDPSAVARALDLGADGVIVPMVESASDASLVGRACRYPPDGVRSWGPTRRKLKAGLPDPIEENRRITCLVMIETAAGLSALDTILAVPEIDGVFVGPADLALSIGGAAVDEAIPRIVEATRRHNKLAGIFGGAPSRTEKWARLGFTYVAIDSDSTLLVAATRDALTIARQQAAAASTPG